MPKTIPLLTPVVCRICKRDWQRGACGDCTLTRQQLDAATQLERAVREHLEAFALLNNNADPGKDDVLRANIQQTYRNMKEALLDEQ